MKSIENRYFEVFCIFLLLVPVNIMYAQEKAISFFNNGILKVVNRNLQNQCTIPIIDSDYYHCHLLLQSDSSYVFELSDTSKNYLNTLPNLSSKVEGKKLQDTITQKNADLKINLSTPNQISDSIYSWHNSLYFAAGYGYPLGTHYELGYNFGVSNGVSFGCAMTLGTDESWMKFYKEATIGTNFSVRIPINSPIITPHVLIEAGTTIAILKEPNKYTLLFLGSIIKLKKGIHLRPEFGVVSTSIHISGGRGFFGPSSPEIREIKVSFGANISLEFDIFKVQ